MHTSKLYNNLFSLSFSLPHRGLARRLLQYIIETEILFICLLVFLELRIIRFYHNLLHEFAFQRRNIVGNSKIVSSISERKERQRFPTLRASATSSHELFIATGIENYFLPLLSYTVSGARKRILPCGCG